MTKKFYFILQIFLSYFFLVSISYADLNEKIINKLETTKTLTFDFRQKIAEEEEIGNCIIKYPLLMKCDYENFKQKSVISNGKTVAVIKKKYKKIYYYPIKKTPLFAILQKREILNLIRNNKPSKINSNLIEFELVNNKSNKLKIFFDKKTLEFKGWETKDAYSNNVSFIIINLETNKIIDDKFFKIPKEEDL